MMSPPIDLFDPATHCEVYPIGYMPPPLVEWEILANLILSGSLGLVEAQQRTSLLLDRHTLASRRLRAEAALLTRLQVMMVVRDTRHQEGFYAF